MNRTIRIGYLVVGLVFLGFATLWLLDETDVINPGGYEWLVPVLLLGAGLVGLFASLGNGLLRQRSRPEDPQPEYSENPETQPITDLTSDLDRRLDEHAATTQDIKNGEAP